MLARTVPCFDYLGFKEGFSIEKPWLFEDFDCLNFYQVSEDELNVLLGLFRSGRYKFEWEVDDFAFSGLLKIQADPEQDIEFDMEEHNKLLEETADEVKEIRAKQAVSIRMRGSAKHVDRVPTAADQTACKSGTLANICILYI